MLHITGRLAIPASALELPFLLLVISEMVAFVVCWLNWQVCTVGENSSAREIAR
jgi:hypothetical protein